MNCEDKTSPLRLDLAGQQWTVAVSHQEIETVHKPILKLITTQGREKNGRFIVFLTGPPGAGKTAAAAIWERFAAQSEEYLKVQALAMDGFHFPNKVLDARTVVVEEQAVSLRKVKGSPESYDLHQLSQELKALRRGDEMFWPFYDRKIHDPVPDALQVQDEGIIVVEGNYLLLNEPGWRELRTYADLTIFIEFPEEMLKKGMLVRAIRGGRHPEDAFRHYEFNDLRNWKRVMSGSMPADITLSVRHGRQLEWKRKQL